MDKENVNNIPRWLKPTVNMGEKMFYARNLSEYIKEDKTWTSSMQKGTPAQYVKKISQPEDILRNIY